MSKEADRTEKLRGDLVGAIMRGTGVREQLALPMANAVLAWLQQEFPGERMYVPQPERRFDLLAMDAELRRGDPPQSVAKRHETTVRQLHRLFPGGLPRPASDAA